MVDYNIVKYCRLCKARFVVKKGESKLYYCNDCQRKYKENKKSPE